MATVWKLTKPARRGEGAWLSDTCSVLQKCLISSCALGIGIWFSKSTMEVSQWWDGFVGCYLGYCLCLSFTFQYQVFSLSSCTSYSLHVATLEMRNLIKKIQINKISLILKWENKRSIIWRIFFFPFWKRATTLKQVVWQGYLEGYLDDTSHFLGTYLLCPRNLPCFISLDSNFQRSVIIILILQMRKMKIKEVR